MPVSQNGYVAGDRNVIYNPSVPGTSITFPGGLRKGPTGELLIYVAEQLHKRVENGGTGYGMWGYAYRPIRGFMLPEEDDRIMAASRIPVLDDLMDLHENNRACCFDNEDTLMAASSLSNHSSGTAIDWSAPKHALGKSGTFSAAQVRTIHTIVNTECERAIRWGGDYSGRKDEMHFEVVANEATCARIVAKVRRSTPTPPPPSPTGPRVLSLISPIMTGEDVKTLQRVLNSWYKVARPAWWPLTEDGKFGANTDKAVRFLQGKAGLAVDGAVGPATRKVLGL
jgi:hypothetical protein